MPLDDVITYDLKSLPIVTSGLTAASILFGALTGQVDSAPDPISVGAVWLNRTTGFANTGGKEPHGYRVDRVGADISDGFGAYQSLIQLGTSSDGSTNTAFAQLGNIDICGMSHWVLNLGATPTTKQPIVGNLGLLFENIPANAAHVQWLGEYDISNYTGTCVFGDQRYGVGANYRANGNSGGAVAECLVTERVSGAPSGTGFLRGWYMRGVRQVGITFEAMAEVGSLQLWNSYVYGDTNYRFTANQDGTLAWGSGSAVTNTSLAYVTGGGLSLTAAVAPLRLINNANNTNVLVATFEGQKGSPVDGDNAYISYKLASDGGQSEFVRFGWSAPDVNVGTGLDGGAFLATVVNNSLTTHTRWDAGALNPGSDNGVSLGSTSLRWSNADFASGAVVRFNSTDTITHSAGLLTFSTPISLGTSNKITLGSIELGHASDTTLTRVSAGVAAIEGSNILLASNLGSAVQVWDNDLDALAANSTNGLWARTGGGTGAARTITGTANQIIVTNGDGVSGAPTVSLPSAVFINGGSSGRLGIRHDVVEFGIALDVYNSGSFVHTFFVQGIVGSTYFGTYQSAEIAIVTNNTPRVKIAANSYAVDIQDATGILKVNGTQVLAIRKTGWTPWSGTADRATHATYTSPTISALYTQAEVQAIADGLQNVSRAYKALLDDMHSSAGHGLVGT